MRETDVRHIFIIGAKSIGQYGGYETFVDKLTEYHCKCNCIKYHIACKMNGEGAMDESKLTYVRPLLFTKDGRILEFEYNNAHVFKIPIINLGSASAIYYDLKALQYTIEYCKKHKISKPYIYILTCRIGPFIRNYVRIIHQLGGEVFLNPDGHEWKRAKWSKPVRMYWKLSERLMVKQADCIICDSINIQKYINEEYSQYSPQTIFIAYGADLNCSKINDDDEVFLNWLNKNKLQLGGFYLMVGRLVPENNHETIIREFMKSTTKKKLVIISNSNPRFLNAMEKNLHFTTDDRICFAGSVYNQELLKKIRENAFCYIHGHEVGGTNPSLLEALSSTRVNILFDIGFNKEVAQDGALYWNKDEGNLSSLIMSLEKMEINEIKTLETNAKNRIKLYYNWKRIADLYFNRWMV